jgi:hypothetical protein
MDAMYKYFTAILRDCRFKKVRSGRVGLGRVTGMFAHMPVTVVSLGVGYTDPPRAVYCIHGVGGGGSYTPQNYLFTTGRGGEGQERIRKTR